MGKENLILQTNNPISDYQQLVFEFQKAKNHIMNDINHIETDELLIFKQKLERLVQSYRQKLEQFEANPFNHSLTVQVFGVLPTEQQKLILKISSFRNIIQSLEKDLLPCLEQILSRN